MQYQIITDSEGKRYKKLPNGTHYTENTNDDMIKLLEDIRENATRCRFHWGDTETGRDWGDDCDVKGRIGRSTGSIKIPLLVYNSRSFGGGALLTDCIVKIVTTKGGKELYKHPTYNQESDI